MSGNNGSHDHDGLTEVNPERIDTPINGKAIKFDICELNSIRSDSVGRSADPIIPRFHMQSSPTKLRLR